ncbi:MAG: hypothetical protein WC332_02350 [Clostridia bacterium]|jgi:hypothetical protein
MWIKKKEFENLKFRISELEKTVNNNDVTINNLVNDLEICSWESYIKEESGWFSMSFQQRYKIGDIIRKILEHLNLKIEKQPESVVLVKNVKK